MFSVFKKLEKVRSLKKWKSLTVKLLASLLLSSFFNQTSFFRFILKSFLAVSFTGTLLFVVSSFHGSSSLLLAPNEISVACTFGDGRLGNQAN
jgi:hypothetical protein